MDGESLMYVGIIIGLLWLLIWSQSEKAKQGRQAQVNTDNQLQDLNLDTDSYFIQNGLMKIGIDINQRKVFQAGIENESSFTYEGEYYSKIQIIDLNNVIDVQIIEDNQVTNKVSNSSMIGRSLVGGALTGGVGAIIGGSTAKSNSTNLVKEISLRFKMNDMEKPYYDISVFSNSKGIDRGSEFFKNKYKEILNLFGRIELVLEKEETE